MVNGHRILATVADELDLVRVLRERCEEINVSRRELSVEAGLTESYAEKLLALPPMKYFGARAFWNIFESLGLAVMIVEDPNATARFAKRMARRDAGKAHKRTTALVKSGRIPWLFNSDTAREMNMRRTEHERREIARQAATIRWDRVKQAARAPDSNAIEAPRVPVLADP